MEVSKYFTKNEGLKRKEKRRVNRYRRLYKLYSRYNWYKVKVIDSFTLYGKGVFVILLFTSVFGLYFSYTMIFILTALMSGFFVTSLIFLFKFSSKIEVERILTKYCLNGQKYRYAVIVKNKGKKVEKGLFLKEVPANPIPSIEEFVYTPEENEGKRNRFDRRMGFYRWSWIIKKNVGTDLKEFPIPDIAPGETREIEIDFIPSRRGYIHFEGLNIIRKDPFSMINKRLFRKFKGSILVLPRIYNVKPPNFVSHRRYNQGGISSALKVGNSEEFILLRDYRTGDQVKNIHWKSLAKTGKLVVKEYNDEFFSRYGLVLDTFLKESYSEIFEGAVSLAASLINGVDLGDSLIDLMFVGKEKYIFTTGRGVSQKEQILDILASVKNSQEEFEEIVNLIKSHVSLVCSLIVILIKINQERKELLELLYKYNIPVEVVLITDDKKKSQEEIKDIGIINPIKIVDINKIEKDFNS